MAEVFAVMAMAGLVGLVLLVAAFALAAAMLSSEISQSENDNEE